MAKAYLIGGAPRAGKTTALLKLVEKNFVLAASTDAVRAAIRSVLDESENPSLFKSDRGAFDSQKNIIAMRSHPELVVDHQNKESELVWHATMEFIESNIEDGKSVAVEGVAVWPRMIQKARYDFSSVFLVNLEDQTEIILKHARDNEFDWLNKYDDDTIEAFCVFNKKLNEYYYHEAQRFNLPVIEVSNDNFADAIDEAVQVLASE